MASADYTRGKMDISDQSSTWSGFMTATLWGSAIIVLAVAYMAFTLALGMNWLVALVICAGAGLIGGLLRGMGGAWIATVIGLSALAVIIQITIWISQALIPG